MTLSACVAVAVTLVTLHSMHRLSRMATNEEHIIYYRKAAGAKCCDMYQHMHSCIT